MPTSVASACADWTGAERACAIAALIILKSAPHDRRPDRRPLPPHSAILPRRGLRGRQRAGDRPLSGLDAAACARSDGQSRHRARAMLSLGQPGVGFLPRRQGGGFRAPLQRLRRRADRAAPKARFGCFGLLPMHDIGLAHSPKRTTASTPCTSKAFRCSRATARNFSATLRSIRCWTISTPATPSSTSIRACIRRASRSTCRGRAS